MESILLYTTWFSLRFSRSDIKQTMYICAAREMDIYTVYVCMYVRVYVCMYVYMYLHIRYKYVYCTGTSYTGKTTIERGRLSVGRPLKKSFKWLKNVFFRKTHPADTAVYKYAHKHTLAHAHICTRRARAYRNIYNVTLETRQLRHVACLPSPPRRIDVFIR